MGSDHRPDDLGASVADVGDLADERNEVVDIGRFAVHDGQVFDLAELGELVAQPDHRLLAGALFAGSSTSPVEMSMSGLIESIEPSSAWAPPMRPPFWRFSRVSSAPKTWVRADIDSAMATTSSADAPFFAA